MVRFLVVGGTEYLACYTSIELLVHRLMIIRRDIRQIIQRVLSYGG
jgi:hypothetical protein